MGLITFCINPFQHRRKACVVWYMLVCVSVVVLIHVCNSRIASRTETVCVQHQSISKATSVHLCPTCSQQVLVSAPSLSSYWYQTLLTSYSMCMGEWKLRHVLDIWMGRWVCISLVLALSKLGTSFRYLIRLFWDGCLSSYAEFVFQCICIHEKQK